MSRLSIDFDEEEDNKIAALKKSFGIKQTTELVRFLITRCYKEKAFSTKHE